MIRDDYKLIHHFGIKGDELFKLDVDPGELNNLLDQHPELVQEMLAELQDWRSDLLIQYRLFFIGQ